MQNKAIDTHPLSWLEFTEDSIITSCKTGMSFSLVFPTREVLYGSGAGVRVRVGVCGSRS